MQAAGPLTLCVLGPLDVRAGGRTPALRRKERALLAYLAATNRTHPRHALADMFCQSAEAPERTLRLLLSRIRRETHPQALLLDGPTVRLNPELGPVDCQRFAHALDGDLGALSSEALEAALGLYRGELAEGLCLDDAPEFELWLAGERARMRLLYERGLGESLRRLVAADLLSAAIERARLLIQSNPLLEEAHAQLIWLYAQTGQREAALRQFELCRDLLLRELAVEPADALRELYGSVLASRVARRPAPATPPAAGSAAPRPPDDFVGRDAELERLRRAWEAARAGQSVAVLIEAEAGSGKTRLAEEFARGLGAPCLTGRCYESTSDLPYYPWIELLERRQAGMTDAALRALSPFVLDYLQRLLPGVARRLGQSVPPAPPTSGGELERFFTAIAEFLFPPAGSGARAPALLFVDDLQWADATSLRLFLFIARRLQRSAALLVGAFRSEELDDAPALQALLRDLSRSAHERLRLAPLGEQAIAALVARNWPSLPAPERPRVAALLGQATGGNALFVVEVLSELAAADEVPATLPVPASVRDLIRRRLRQLPTSSRQAIETLAIFDMPATLAEIQLASGRSEDEVALAVDMGLRRGLLASRGDGPARHDFSHDLIRQATVGQIGETRRRLLHRRVAGTLAQTAARLQPDLRGAIAGRIARHARAGDDFALVFRWAPQAAEHSQRLHAYADALAALEAASEAFEHVRAEPDFDWEAGERQQIEILLGCAALIPSVGRPIEEHRSALERAAGLLARNPDAQLQSTYALRNAELLMALDKNEQAAEAALDAHEQFLALGDRRRAVQSLYIAANSKLTISQNSVSRRLLGRALELCRAGGDTASESLCLSGLALCSMNLGDVAGALTHLERALAIAEQEADRLGIARACGTLAFAWGYYYAPERIRAFAERAAQLYGDMGHTLRAYRALLFLAQAYTLEGHQDRAEATIALVFDEAHAQHDSWLEGWAAQLLGRLVLRRGDLALAERWLQHAYQLRQASGEIQNQISDLTWMAHLRLMQRRPAEALGHTRRAVAQLEQLWGEFYVWEMPDVFLTHAEALVAAGEAALAPAQIERAYETLMRFAAQIADPHTRRAFLAYPLNARVAAAHESGAVPPLI